MTIAILAKSPVPGFAKTRLATVLGNEGAADLHARFIAHTVATAQSAAVGPVTLWAAPDCRHPVLQTIAATLGVALAKQPEGDLGVRMIAAAEASCGPAIVIGTDCPALAPEHLRTAAAVLFDGIDVVVIPVDDGGYGLIGMQQPEPALFEGMTWSTASVMAETRRRLTRLGLSWREPARLWDVDMPADLERLASTELASLMR